VSTQFAAQAAVNANLTDALAAAALAAQAAQAEQAAAQAAAMSNVTETLAAVLGGLSALEASVGALSARMDAVEANTGLLDSLVVSPPLPPPLPPQPPSPPPPTVSYLGCYHSFSVGSNGCSSGCPGDPAVVMGWGVNGTFPFNYRLPGSQSQILQTCFRLASVKVTTTFLLKIHPRACVAGVLLRVPH
jgi:hypothetical protein